jgi:hypothetical protein
MRSMPTGIAVKAPATEEHRTTLESACREHPDVVETEVGWLLAVVQRKATAGPSTQRTAFRRPASFLREPIAPGL